MRKHWRWNEDAQGNASVWAHWQNLNEDARGNAEGRLPWHGRAWLHVGGHRGDSFRVEWNLWSKTCGIGVTTERGGDDTIAGHVAFPPVAFYFGAELRKDRLVRRIADWVSEKSADMFGRRESKWSGSRTSLRIFDGAIWWQLFADDRGWTCDRPRWRDGNWKPADTFLGKTKYTRLVVEDAKEVLVPMPERAYAGTVLLTEDTWKRPRWFAKTKLFATVEMTEPVPIPGKGENSYDCGEDAIHSASVSARTVEDAIVEVVRSALRTRKRHGGTNWLPEPAEIPLVEGTPLAASSGTT